MSTTKSGLKCRFCKRSLRGIAKVGGKFSEMFNRKCPKSQDGICWRQTQTTMKAGRGKKSLTIILDDAAVPSRRASLSARARWASEYLKRFFSGQTVNKKTLHLALKWIDETIVFAFQFSTEESL